MTLNSRSTACTDGSSLAIGPGLARLAIRLGANDVPGTHGFKFLIDRLARGARQLPGMPGSKALYKAM